MSIEHELPVLSPPNPSLIMKDPQSKAHGTILQEHQILMVTFQALHETSIGPIMALVVALNPKP